MTRHMKEGESELSSSGVKELIERKYHVNKFHNLNSLYIAFIGYSAPLQANEDRCNSITFSYMACWMEERGQKR